MKKITLTFLTIISLIVASTVLSSWNSLDQSKRLKHSGGPDAGYAGDPAGGSKTCCECHSDGSPMYQAGMITSNVPAAGFKADSIYTITCTITMNGYALWGFEVTPQSATGASLGSVTLTSAQTQIVTAAGATYITQSPTGNAGAGTKTWSFNWTAPHTDTTAVNFYGTFCAADGDGTDQGDNIYTSALTIHHYSAGAGVGELSIASTFNIFPNPINDHVNISYTLNKAQSMTISLVDINGKVCETLFEGVQSSGKQELNLSLRNKYASGVYFIRLSTEGDNVNKKVYIQ